MRSALLLVMRSALAVRASLLSRPGLAAARPFCRSMARMSASNDQGIQYPVQKSESEWMTSLSGEQFEILRRKGTEYPGSGEYNKFSPAEGHFACAGCSQPLYSAQVR
jgi:peptide-methionine (R)-S-oxide reductase